LLRGKSKLTLKSSGIQLLSPGFELISSSVTTSSVLGVIASVIEKHLLSYLLIVKSPRGHESGF
jgi:hypothetical protein